MTVDEFKKLYTQFAELSDEVIQNRLDDFSLYFSTLNLGKFKEKAQGLFSAHMLTLEKANAVDKDNIDAAISRGNFVEEEKTPEFSVKYAVPEYFANGNEMYMSLGLKETIYGRELLFILYRSTPLARLV